MKNKSYIIKYKGEKGFFFRRTIKCYARGINKDDAMRMMMYVLDVNFNDIKSIKETNIEII